LQTSKLIFWDIYKFLIFFFFLTTEIIQSSTTCFSPS